MRRRGLLGTKLLVHDGEKEEINDSVPSSLENVAGDGLGGSGFGLGCEDGRGGAVPGALVGNLRAPACAAFDDPEPMVGVGFQETDDWQQFLRSRIAKWLL